MGITALEAEFLIQGRANGHPFGRTLSLGRQSMFVSPVDLGRLLRRYDLFPAGMSDEEFYRRQFSSPYFADEFFRVLGADELMSMDFSPYEQASITHDLNVPVGDDLKESFDTLIDCGTLEHVFNFPVAIRNVMEMTKVGGTIYVTTPANSEFGHGLYQFSAELFYRVFSKENGFEVQRMHIAETGLLNRVKRYSVADPAKVHERVCLSGSRPAYLAIQARRIARQPIFARPPQQSDYETQWDHAEATGTNKPATTFPSVGKLQITPGKVQFSPRWAQLKHIQLHWLPVLHTLNPLNSWKFKRNRSPSNRRHFKPVR